MIIIHDKGSDYVGYIFKERKFENKLKNFVKYANSRNLLNNIIYKRKNKPERILVFYRYRTPNKIVKNTWNYFDSAKWMSEPPYTAHRIIPPIAEFAEDLHTRFRLQGSDAVELREITLLYIYGEKKSSEPEWISSKPKRKR